MEIFHHAAVTRHTKYKAIHKVAFGKGHDYILFIYVFIYLLCIIFILIPSYYYASEDIFDFV